MDQGSEARESILQRWVGSWVELHYAASSAEVTPHGAIVTGPPETRVGAYLLEAVDDRGIEAFIPDPHERRTIFVPWNSVLLVRGPSREELEQAERTEEAGRERQELMDQLASARTSSEIADAKAAADSWLADHPSDGDVRAAREQLETRSPDDADLEEGSPT
ncbi:MAG: hypothetical protein M3246_03215 [Actinomycetota bacterium]|nr:hypothetical protein [Actinomycetota bacterium]